MRLVKFADKIDINTSGLDNTNKITSANINELKEIINFNANAFLDQIIFYQGQILLFSLGSNLGDLHALQQGSNKYLQRISQEQVFQISNSSSSYDPNIFFSPVHSSSSAGLNRPKRKFVEGYIVLKNITQRIIVEANTPPQAEGAE